MLIFRKRVTGARGKESGSGLSDILLLLAVDATGKRRRSGRRRGQGSEYLNRKVRKGIETGASG